MEKELNPNQLSPLNLAFIGDCVFSLMVREKLLRESNRPVNDLHKDSVKLVNASKQAEFIDLLMPYLTETEIGIFKRGRNAHTVNSSKSSTVEQYHKATGFEALFGFLYLKGDYARLKELFDIICK